MPSGAEEDCMGAGDAHRLIARNHRLGHDAIDRDHAAIADWWSQAVSCEQIQAAFFIARLKKLMREHFEREAMLIERAGGRLCDCHKREHQLLLDLCDEAAALSGRNWRSARSLLRTKLAGLLREHILCMDQCAVLLINTNGATAQACS
jgi:hemerythrin